MTKFDKMRIGLLLRAKDATDDARILVHEIAYEYGVEVRFVRETLVDLHTQKLIRLSAWDDNEVRDKPFDEWPRDDSFFAARWDSGYKRVRLLVRGAELLEKLSVTVGPEPPKRSIGFHS
jgi:hypothetical protein